MNDLLDPLEQMCACECRGLNSLTILCSFAAMELLGLTFCLIFSLDALLGQVNHLKYILPRGGNHEALPITGAPRH